MATLSFYMGVPPTPSIAPGLTNLPPLINPPENWQEIEIECSFENDSPIASVKTNSFSFVSENAIFINKWVAQGMTGGVGLFEGIPFVITAGGIAIFTGVLDLQNDANEFDCDRCTVAIKQVGAIDWLTDIADSFSFAYLASNLSKTNSSNPAYQPITINDFIKVPYVINTIPQYIPALSMAISEFLVAKEIVSTVYQLVEANIKLATDIVTETTAVADTVQVPPTVTAGAALTTITTLDIVVDVAVVIALTVYLIGLMIAFIELMQEIMDDLIQPDKYKYGMLVRTLFQKACDYLNIKFSSTILNTASSPYCNLAIIPTKQVIAGSSAVNMLSGNKNLPFDEGTVSFFVPGETGYQYNPNAYGYFDGTFGDLIRQMNDVFNAKIKITTSGTSTTLEFERFDKYQDISTYQLPDLWEVPYGTNASDLSSNYYISFATDDDDLNTFNDYAGTNAQCVFVPVIKYNQTNLLFNGIVNKNLTFAQAKIKTTQTFIEKVVQGIFNDFINLLYGGIYNAWNGIVHAVNAIASIIHCGHVSNSLPTPASLTVPSRVGWMLLENDFIGTQKLFIAQPIKNGIYQISPTNNIYLTAICLLANFHNHSFIVDNGHAGINNQFQKYKSQEVPFCCADYMKILNNNYVKAPVGVTSWTIAKVEKVLWSPEQDTAKIDYYPKIQWTKNINQQYVGDGINLPFPLPGVPIF